MMHGKAAEREKQFRKDLKTLLAAYNADMHITDDRKPYGQHNSIVEISIPAYYGDNLEVLAEQCYFNL